MLDEEKLIQILKLELAENKAIGLAILFGSYAKGSARFESDMDLAIRFEKPLSKKKRLEFIQSLAKLSGTAVDLLDLSTVGEPVLSEIIKHGRLIKGDKQAFTELAIKNVYANEDFRPYIKRTLQERRKKWIS